MSAASPKWSAASPGPSPEDPARWSLAAAERDTGLSRDTLLDWESRYGFPVPARDSAGQRQYSSDQVQRLRSIRRALEAGHAADRVVPAAPDDLARLAGAGPDREPPTSELQGTRRAVIERLIANDVAGLRGLLQRALADLGLSRFVHEFVAPLNVEVGDAWMQGRLEVFQEHLYTETVQGLLRRALHDLPATGAQRPVVLLTTAGGELHGLGLLMVEAVLRLKGCRCISLGVQTPLWDVVRAASALGADAVALSYTGAADPGRIVDDLTELRRKLPRMVDLWAGGSAAALHRHTIDGVLVAPDLGYAVEAVTAWRARERPVPAGSGPCP